jgi:hypothetical protein
MRKSIRALALVTLAALLAVAAYLTLRGFNLLGAPSLAEAKNVPPGHQEIAFLAPASAGDTWERLVAAVDALGRDWPELHKGRPQLRVNKDGAFAQLTTDVAEVALWLDGHEGARLWVRWYKLSSAIKAEQWLDRLAERDPPPLAVLGGDISDRAVAQGRELQKRRGKWRGADPLFLMTTATADRYHPTGAPNQDPVADNWPLLMELYKGRTFRFSFSNEHMAEVVLDFVRRHPQSWPPDRRRPAGLAGAAGLADPWAAWACIDRLRPHVLHSLAWEDDSYSLDLAAHLNRAFPAAFRGGTALPNYILYSTGDHYHPNPREALLAGFFLPNPAERPAAPELLALPTNAQRAQRFLRTVVRRHPLRARNLIVVSGDSISFNNVYRDRNVLWNIQDVPMPLVFFAHRNPVAVFKDATGNQVGGFRELRPSGGATADCSGTDDLILHRDVFDALVQSCYCGGRLVAGAEALRGGLRAARWNKGRVVVPGFAPGREAEDNRLPLLFEDDGNRRDRTGEHVVLVQPTPQSAELPQADISVWRWQATGGENNGWVEVRRLVKVPYDSGAAAAE